MMNIILAFALGITTVLLATAVVLDKKRRLNKSKKCNRRSSKYTVTFFIKIKKD